MRNANAMLSPMIVCLLLLKCAQQVRSFSALTVQPEIVDVEMPPTRSTGLPQSLFSHESYLRFHQSVGKRKTFRRLMEITTVVSGKIVRPLVCSFVRQGPHLPTSSDSWDEFWLQTRGPSKLSNAQRVAQGLPTLGPTFVKLGQALATRPDILHPPLADALANLQDRMLPFDNYSAKRIIRRDLKKARNQVYLTNDDDFDAFLSSLSDQPVAAASIAQVYKGRLPGYGDVAVKVQRPGIRKTVEKDATLFHSVATWLEGLTWPRWAPLVPGEPLFGSEQITKAVDEFTARVLEDMDFCSEAKNMELFAEMYCHRRGSSPTVQVVVPELIPELCSSQVIVMEWLEGTKLTDINGTCSDPNAEVQENLALIEKAIEITLSQLLTEGLIHCDPHTGNLLKVRTADGKPELGYLDFGLVNSVPQRFQDGIVCATCQLVFARNTSAVADLCVDLGLLPEDKLKDPEERTRFVRALEQALDDVLIWPKNSRGRSTGVPRVRFNNALASVSKLIASFEFTIPPYFLNNCRALATLEGIALKLDPNFNILRVIYPYSINHLMRNPTVSKKAEETFLNMCRSPEHKLFDLNRFMILLNDWSLLTGYRKRKIYWDLATSVGWRRVMLRIGKEFFLKRFRWVSLKSKKIASLAYRIHDSIVGSYLIRSHA